MDRVPMTPEGHRALEAELKRHLEELRPQIVKDIEEARAHGDISENSEYEDAKHRQALCEGRIAELKGKLARAEIIRMEDLEPSDRVVFGTTVELEDQETEETVRYRIVGVDEADVSRGMISFSSPIGRALIGRSVGDEVQVRTPGGLRSFIIVDVHYQ
ncbi:MAG: transcription elongation factor GreA [Deltaproteobacteria bacterium]|nr:MAG: transcription elongation factor GreA [Deltaproteobacteria bacterium]